MIHIAQFQSFCVWKTQYGVKLLILIKCIKLNLRLINLNYLQKKSEVHFEGNAREASKLYPKNANVAATIALMGIGFEKTKVKLIADDTISENVHELVISGEFGESQFKILGKPLPDNPKSSSLAAMSIIDETKKFIDNLAINM